MINKLMSVKGFPTLAKLVMFLVMIFLIVTGFMAYSDDAFFLKQLRYTNLANLLVWSYWWPVIVLLAVVFGRVWCLVCPVELIASWLPRIGFKRSRPNWVLSGWMITVFFILILFFGIEILEIHRNPAFMAVYLLTIIGVAVLVGLIYEKNTFCRYFCPVGYLLGIYSRLASWGWKVKKQDVCDSCKDKSCISKFDLYNLESKSCGVDLQAFQLNTSTDCILCGGCRKVCSKGNTEGKAGRPNPGYYRTGFARGLFNLNPLKPAEVAFIFVVSGFVLNEILTEYGLTNIIMSVVSGMLPQSLGVTNSTLFSLLSALELYVIIPFIFWALPYGISLLWGLRLKLGDYLKYYSLVFIPLMAAAHISKSILKTTSRLPYLDFAFMDIRGMETAKKISEGDIELGTMLPWTNVVVTVFITLAFSASLIISFIVVKKLNNKLFPNKYSAYFLYLLPLFYISVFIFTIYNWRF